MIDTTSAVIGGIVAINIIVVAYGLFALGQKSVYESPEHIDKNEAMNAVTFIRNFMNYDEATENDE